MDKRINLEILSAEHSILNKKVDLVSLPAVAGAFEILYNHRPIISSLKKGKIVYSIEGQKESIDINSGFARLKNNDLKICIEL